MSGSDSNRNSNPFFVRFPDDPECIRTLTDTEAIERIPADERFPCNSPIDAIETITKHYPDAIALSFLPNGRAEDTPQRWTYREYWQEIIATANLFRELGLEHKESVAFLLPNMPEMLFGFWGAEAAGIAAPINPFLQPEQIAGIAKEADARILVTLHPGVADNLSPDYGYETFLEKALEAQRHAPSIQHIITVGGSAEGTTNWADAVARQPHYAFTFERSLTGSETASYFHTGGTTGTPKLARHTHRAEVINVGQMALTGLSEKDREGIRSVILCGLPLFHVNAVFVSALSAIIGGGELILAGTQGFREKSLIKDFWQLVEHYRVTFFAGVPTIYASLLQQPSAGYDLSSLLSCSCGAAPMPVSLLRDFHERTGADISEGYGMTETTVCATTHVYYGDRKVGSIGMRLPYQKIRIVGLDKEGGIKRDCETNEIGVLLLSGPNVIPEYKQAEANKGSWPELGWLNSGDMGRIDEDGYLWLTGRAKDLIIRGGHNIDPLITEDALTSHPDVEMAAAVGKPDAYAGELPIAYVQLRAGAKITEEELKEYAREHVVERAAAPVQVIISDTLPKTAVGKVFKPELRKNAIALGYRETVLQAWPEGDVETQVQDDKVHGLKVVLRLKANEPDLAEAMDKIGPKLNELAYYWSMEAN